MTKKISFKTLKNFLRNMTNNNKTLLPYQKKANIEFFNLVLGKIENGSLPEWIWPDAQTSFTKKDGMCCVRGPLARIL